MQRPSFVPFVPIRGQSRNTIHGSRQQENILQPMNSRTLPTLPLLIQEAPPEDARLLDAAHTLVNLQQTTERQPRQNIGSGQRSSNTQRGQELSHSINPQSPILRRNQLSISPVRSSATASSGLIVTHLPTPITSSLSIVRNPVSIQMVGSTTSSLVVTSLGNSMAKAGSSSNLNTHTKDNLLPERTMMPPPSIGRGGGRGGTGRGVKTKGASIAGVSPGRGRGRGRGRGVPNTSGSTSATSKGNPNLIKLPLQNSGIYMDEKQDRSITSPRGMVKSPDVHASLRIITASDHISSEESGMDDTSLAMDTSNRIITSDGGCNTNNDKDTYNEYMNGDDSTVANDTAESTFVVGNLNVKNSIFDDLLNERKIELFSDPEVMALLSSVMQQSKNHNTD